MYFGQNGIPLSLCLVRLFLVFALGNFVSNAIAETSPATPKLYRAINLNGPSLLIDDVTWEAGEEAVDVKYGGKTFENQSISLSPPTDSERAKMIRSSRWGSGTIITLQNVPPGVYQVFAYCWEDNDPEKFSINLNGRTVVLEHNSGTAGRWKRLGPWRTVVRDKTIRISSHGGTANFSGIEVWAGDGEVPDPYERLFTSSPTPDELNFFESRVRPLLVEKCYDCHSAEAGEPGGGLLIDSKKGLIRGGETDRAIVPGEPNNSLLFKAAQRLTPSLAMPPDEPLSPEELKVLETWIQSGAPDPRTEDTVALLKAQSELDLKEARDFWSLQPISNPTPPEVKNKEWPFNEVDQFILSKLEETGLAPTDDASKWTWIRRATYDLTGLPPSPSEVETFLQDESSQAYEKVVDRLLDSPRYGERWGRHWLDVVRYSDTAGDNSDFPVPQMHLYRDWVINAFNRDLPYATFIREQLAGDLMESETPELKRQRYIATGYIANSRRFGSRVDDYPQHLTIEDTIDNLGKTFLATTINCARCHNHKFDPVSAKDYYAIYGIFHSTRYPWPGIELDQKQRDLVPLADQAEIERFETERKANRAPLEAALRLANQAVARVPQGDEAAKKDANEKLKQVKETLKIYDTQPTPYETLYAVQDSKSIEDVAVQIKGEPSKPGEVVPRRFLSVLGGQELPPTDVTSGRLQLANWIADENNPLTARVMVNRIWQYHFGRGIVETPNDFGRQGKNPSHPDLLDWLATHFMEEGWSVKRLHRTIMLSHTYRLGSDKPSQALEIDPTNAFLSSFPRRRLDAESIRDTMLLHGGSLDLSPSGPHPFPPQGEWNFTQHNPFKAIYETNHRSVYLMTQRIQRHPYLAIFDGPDPATSTGNRTSSTTPLQALYLLNDKFVHDQASGFTERLLAQSQKDSSDLDKARLELVWNLLFSRPITPDEQQQALNGLQKIATAYRTLETPPAEVERLAWQAITRSLFRSNEFVTID